MGRIWDHELVELEVGPVTIPEEFALSKRESCSIWKCYHVGLRVISALATEALDTVEAFRDYILIVHARDLLAFS